jgi:predicted transcriptional regulator
MTVFFVQRKDGYKVTDIKVHKHTDNFTIIANNVFFDYELSYQAKGLLCQLLSLPPNWKISIDGLSQLATNGNTSVRSILTELCEAGYVIRTQIRNKGKLAGWNYDVYEERQTAEKTVDSPNVENPHTESPHVDDNIQLSTNTIKDSNDKVHDIYTREDALQCNTDVTEAKRTGNLEKKKKEPKHRYGEYNHVTLTDKEYNTLVDEYGEQKVLLAIKNMDEYCEMKGKTYKSYYLALKKWGMDAVNERSSSGNENRNNNGNTNSTEQGTGASVPDNPFEGMSEEELRKQAEMFGIQWR